MALDVLACVMQDHGCMARPLHVQSMEHALSLDPLLEYVDAIMQPQPATDSEDESTTDTDLDLDQKPTFDKEENAIYNGIVTSRAERRADKSRLYNFSRVRKGRKWLKNILLSDSSSDEDDEKPVSEDDIKHMLKMRKMQIKMQNKFFQDKDLQQYQYYSVGLLSNYDKFPDHQKTILGPKKKAAKEQRKMEKKMKAKMKKLQDKQGEDNENESPGPPPRVSKAGRPPKAKKLTPEQMAVKRKRIWMSIVKKEVPRAYKQKVSSRKEMLSSLKKISKDCVKDGKRKALATQKVAKETQYRARRLARETLAYWKKFEKVEKEHRRRAEKEAIEQRKMDIELLEMKRQQRKLNFLITQTELYAHFMSRKMTGESDEHCESILKKMEEKPTSKEVESNGGVLRRIEGDTYDADEMKDLALRNAQDAFDKHTHTVESFDAKMNKGSSVFANPTLSTEEEQPQPSIFTGKLKGYQLKGMNWLANLYNQGINGILADEMGLGKTVQSISFMAHLAEAQGLWGPFLVVAPASTLHNWQQECSRFVPSFKVVPYWGNTQERKILRKFWNSEHLNTREASFHVVITSYQLVIQDVKYFQKIKWLYMILDEAQAIKSTSSARWKTLLGFNCRNRLLLTGTPIQNTMAELWALLHFIMPTMFDSHDEFNEWFSKDIESHAEKQSGIDESSLSRLHMILKPFMLRRVKRDVENELSDKIEILVYCPLTMRQKFLYQAVKNKISIEDLIQSSSSNASSSQTTTSSLMNLVMQFRKVCNHPELFERREIRGPFAVQIEPYHVPKLVYTEGTLETSLPSKNHILYNLLNIFTCHNIHQSVQCDNQRSSSLFSFIRFINLSPSELHQFMLGSLLVRWLALFLSMKQAYRVYHKSSWSTSDSAIRFLDRDSFILEPLRSTYFPHRQAHPEVWSELVFTSPNAAVYSFQDHVHHSTRETMWHLRVRLRHQSGKAQPAANRALSSPPLSPTQRHLQGARSPPPTGKHKPAITSPTKGQSKVISDNDLDLLTYQHKHVEYPPKTYHCQPTYLPTFLRKTFSKIVGRSFGWYCSDRSAATKQISDLNCGSWNAEESLLYGTADLAEESRRSKFYFKPGSSAGLLGLHVPNGYSQVHIPDKETLISDAGKLYVLDILLARLKSEGHRVLIYSQMTRMIDILEEYMWHRKHTYMRLDGSSKISDRRDMVADFQAKSDIFVFLLSTRAGGLGINLTAADTVIFYDSDWNPTVDQQAMDRAHRLGQTKQVTVYRLICKGTIEERILQRAKEKSEIQRMVISGGQFRPDTLKPKEVVSLLLDDDEMETKVRSKQTEKKAKEEQNKERDRKRKREKYAAQGKKEGTGRGPGRPKKIRPEEESNLTIPAPGIDSDSLANMDSAAASPQSVASMGLLGDESSNDGLLVVDEASQSSTSITSAPPAPSSNTPAKRGTGRPRGRPKGSGTGRRRGSSKKAMAAAELAGAEAAKLTLAISRSGNNSPAASRSTTPSRGSTGTPTQGFYSQTYNGS